MIAALKHIRRSVTVFVKPAGKMWLANTHCTEAMNPDSPEDAAKQAAARFLQVPEAEVHLHQESGHVYTGFVKQRPLKQRAGDGMRNLWRKIFR